MANTTAVYARINTELKNNEYSGAAEPPFRKIGNRESGAGNRHTAIVTFASLLA